MKLHPRVVITLKLVVSIGLIAFLITRVDLQLVQNRLSDMRWVYVLLALSILLAQVPVATYRWRCILSSLGVKVSWLASFRLVFMGLFFNQTLPSTIGGDVVRAWGIVNAGATVERAATSVISDRVLALVATAILITISLPWSIQLIDDALARWSLYAVITFVAVGAPLGYAVIRLFAGRSFITRPARFLQHMLHDAQAVLFSLPLVTKAIAASLVIMFCSCAAVASLAAALDLGIPPQEILLLLPPVMLISALPVSIAGWGVREAAMIVAFGFVAVTETDALVLSVMFGLIVMVNGLPGGFLWLLDPRSPPASEQAVTHG